MVTVFDYLRIKDMDNLKNFILKIKNKETNFPDTPYEYNPYYVLDRIRNREMRRKIIRILINKKYDFNSPFPYEYFNSHERELLLKVEDNLKKEYAYYMFYVEKGHIFKSFNGLNCIVCKTDKQLTPFIFRINYDLLINISKKNEIFIILNPKHKRTFSLENLFNKLSKIEKDNWVIWDKNTVVKTKSNSSVSPDTITDFISTFDLKKL